MDATPASTGLNIIINVVMVRKAARERKSSPWRHPPSPSTFTPPLVSTFISRLGARLSFTRSNASRQNVFYCVHAQETFIINPDHGSLPPAWRSGCLSVFSTSFPQWSCLLVCPRPGIERVENPWKNSASRFVEESSILASTALRRTVGII